MSERIIRRDPLGWFARWILATVPGDGCRKCGSPCAVCGKRPPSWDEMFHVFHGECFCSKCFEAMSDRNHPRWSPTSDTAYGARDAQSDRLVFGWIYK